MKRLGILFALLTLLVPPAFSQAIQGVQFKVTLVWANGDRLSDKQDVKGMPGVQGSSRDAGGQPIRGDAVSNMAIRIAVLNDVGQTVAETSPTSQGDATFTVVGGFKNSQGHCIAVTFRVVV